MVMDKPAEEGFEPRRDENGKVDIFSEENINWMNKMLKKSVGEATLPAGEDYENMFNKGIKLIKDIKQERNIE